MRNSSLVTRLLVTQRCAAALKQSKQQPVSSDGIGCFSGCRESGTPLSDFCSSIFVTTALRYSANKCLSVRGCSEVDSAGSHPKNCARPCSGRPEHIIDLRGLKRREDGVQSPSTLRSAIFAGEPPERIRTPKTKVHASESAKCPERIRTPKTKVHASESAKCPERIRTPKANRSYRSLR